VTATRINRHINAPRAKVYRALLDARAVAKWMVPDGMTSQVHDFNPREGGAFRISLTYIAPTVTGKTSAHTRTSHGRFVKLVANAKVVEVSETLGPGVGVLRIDVADRLLDVRAAGIW